MAVSHLALLMLIVSMYDLTHAIILRPDWWPYFEDTQGRSEDGSTLMTPRKTRQYPGTGNCPPGIPEYECYQELMAVWTRVLKKNKRFLHGKNFNMLLHKP